MSGIDLTAKFSDIVYDGNRAEIKANNGRNLTLPNWFTKPDVKNTTRNEKKTTKRWWMVIRLISNFKFT
jgi:hypothetical protein